MNDNDDYTFKSIIYWCKTSNPEEYKNIYNKTVDYHYYSFRNNTECDLAATLKMYKAQFVCASIEIIHGMNSTQSLKLMIVAVL